MQILVRRCVLIADPRKMMRIVADHCKIMRIDAHPREMMCIIASHLVQHSFESDELTSSQETRT